MEENKDKSRDEIFSERVRAGKRTYFFDVKATRSNDYYLTITESKRRYKEDGFVYEKHKIFLYKEDFEKFANALNTSVDYVKTELLPGVDFNEFERKESTSNDGSHSNLESKKDMESTTDAESATGTETETNMDTETETDTDTDVEKTEIEEGGDSDLKWE